MERALTGLLCTRSNLSRSGAVRESCLLRHDDQERSSTPTRFLFVSCTNRFALRLPGSIPPRIRSLRDKFDVSSFSSIQLFRPPKNEALYAVMRRLHIPTGHEKGGIPS